MKWDRDKLLMELPRFSFSAKSKTIGEIEKYYEHYHINFSKEYAAIDQRIGWIDTAAFRIAVQTFIPVNSRASVFLFHGYFDHAGIYKHLIRVLLDSGYSVVIYDMPGHGLSSGKPAAIDSFQQYQEVLDACISLCSGHLAEPYHAIGQSTGGAVLIDRLTQGDKSSDLFDKVIMLAPLVRPVGWRAVGTLHTVLNPFVRVWFRSFSQNSNDSNFVGFLKEHDPLQSKWLALDWIKALKEWIPRIESGNQLQRKIKIVQGTADSTVDWKHNIEVLKRLFSHVEISYIEEARHHLVNESIDIRKKVFDEIIVALNES